MILLYYYMKIPKNVQSFCHFKSPNFLNKGKHHISTSLIKLLVKQWHSVSALGFYFEG